MADRYDNTTGKLTPDGRDDSLAPANIRAAGDAAVAMAEAEARAAYMSSGTAADPLNIAAIPVDTTTRRVTITPDDSFKVQTGWQYQTGQGVVPKFGGVDTVLGAGFVGQDDEAIMAPMKALVGNQWDKYEAVYGRAVQQAAIMQKAGKDVTVTDLLSRWARGGAPDEIKRYLSSGSGGGGGGAFSTTTRSVSLSDAGTARMVLNSALSRYLGREATAAENRKFLSALNVQEKENPTITTAKGYSDGSGNTTQSSTTTGGFNRDDYAIRFAQAQQGYAEYQAATTYLDAFANALESDSRVI